MSSFIELIKNNRFIVIGALVLFGIALVFIVTTSVNPPITDHVEPDANIIIEKPVSGPNTWNKIVPGTTKYAGSESVFGKLLRSSTGTNGSVIYSYDLIGPYAPNSIGVSSQGVVEYMRLFNPYNKSITYSAAMADKKLVSPDMTMYLSSDPDMVVAVFLSSGVALEYNILSKELLWVRYFTPTTKELFLSTWGKDLVVKPAPSGN